MKKLTIALFTLGCATAFGQAMSSPSNSIQYREFAVNAEPLGHKITDIETNTQLQNVAVIEEAGNEFTALTIGDVRLRLEMRIAALQNERQPLQPIKDDKTMVVGNNAATEQDLAFALYPNPTREQFTINSVFDKAEKVNLRVYDSAGNLVSTIMSDVMVERELNQTINTSGYSAGEYTVILQAGDKVSSKALIVTK